MEANTRQPGASARAPARKEPPRASTRSRMDDLGRILAAYPGLDHVEVRVESVSGDVMRMELPCTVDARNMVLLAEVTDAIGRAGKVLVA